MRLCLGCQSALCNAGEPNRRPPLSPFDEITPQDDDAGARTNCARIKGCPDCPADAGDRRAGCASLQCGCAADIAKERAGDMRASALSQSIIGLIAVWAVLLVGAYLAPQALPNDDPADVVTRQTARVAVLYWGIAAGAILLRRTGFGRWAWTLGCVAFLVHVVTAFDRVHGWSNSSAVRHVEDVTGFGTGLYFSYAFTALWVFDAAWWWLDPPSHESRPDWLDRAVHGFMAFMVFGSTVIYEAGFVRWTGVSLFVSLAILLGLRLYPGNKVRFRT